MFSGIVEEMGAVSILNKGLAGTRLTIMASTIPQPQNVNGGGVTTSSSA